jgi:hypothetical protein
MERYHDFQIKDHYFWTDAAQAKAQPEPKPQPKPATHYRSWAVREADGSTTYYDAQVCKPVIIDGYMV